MYKSISDVAKLLKVSRQTIYNKLDKGDLDKFTKVIDKVKFISPEGIEALKKMFSPSNDTVNKQSNSQKESKYIDTLIESLRTENKSLKDQLSIKDNQILDLIRLLENMQVLQREKKLLEESTNKKSFWGRFFN